MRIKDYGVRIGGYGGVLVSCDRMDRQSGSDRVFCYFKGSIIFSFDVEFHQLTHTWTDEEGTMFFILTEVKKEC